MKNKDYILGIDIGHGQIKVSYFNEENKNAEIYDFSFGKGSPGIPAVAQKIKDELIFGDLAITIPGPIIKDISADEEIISALIDEILATISEREPNARVKHITFAISENTKLEPLKTAIEKLGIPENLVEFKTESDCILNFYLSKKSDIYKNILVLDYGTQALRISLFKKKEKRVYIKESSHFDKELGMRALEKNLNDTLSKIYEKHTNKILSMDDIYNIRAFTHENKNAIFKNMKGIKLHLNFSEPIEHILYTPLLFEPFMDKFEDFIKNFINLQSINASDIEEVILIGGGFNMPWPLNIIENILPDANIIISKKYEHLISLGAATIAKTNRLDLVQIEKPSINFDIGIFVDVVKELEKTRAFYPLIQSGQINQHETYRVNIIADLTSDFKFNLYKDSPDQKEPAILKTIKIPNLHKPEYAGALEVCLNINNNILNIKVIDKSFKNPKGVVFTDSMQLI